MKRSFLSLEKTAKKKEFELTLMSMYINEGIKKNTQTTKETYSTRGYPPKVFLKGVKTLLTQGYLQKTTSARRSQFF